MDHKPVHDLSKVLQDTQSLVDLFWASKLDAVGNFEHTFGDPSATPYSVNMCVGVDHLGNSFPYLTFPGENESLQGFDDEQKTEIEEVVERNSHLLSSDVPAFAKAIYDHLFSVSQHPSFVNADLDKLQRLKDQYQEEMRSKKASQKGEEVQHEDNKVDMKLSKMMYKQQKAQERENRRAKAEIIVTKKREEERLMVGIRASKRREAERVEWEQRQRQRQVFVIPPVSNHDSELKRRMEEMEFRRIQEQREQERREQERAAFEATKLQILYRNFPKASTSDDPEFVGYLERVYIDRAIRVLYSNSKIKSIPSFIAALNWVEEINLSGNHLDALPVEVVSIPKLKRLYLHDNNIKFLPSLKCPLLEVLDLQKNSLMAFPDGIGELSNLQTLDVEKNKIVSIPLDLADCTKLSYLNMASNSIRIIPAQLGFLTNLSYFNLKNNPIRNLPAYVYAQGTRFCLQFLRERTGDVDIPKSSIRDHLSKLVRGQIHDFSRTIADIVLKSKEGHLVYCHTPILKARCPMMTSMIEANRNGPTDSEGIPILQLSLDKSQLLFLVSFIYGEILEKPELKQMEANSSMNEEEVMEMSRANYSLLKLYQSNWANYVNVANTFNLLLPKKVECINGIVIESLELEHSTYEADLKKLLLCEESGIDADVSFKFGENEPQIHAHKSVLCARSPYFASMFTSGLAETKQRVVPISNISYAVFKDIIEFSYTDDVHHLDAETIIDLLIASKLCGFERLQATIEAVVGYSIDSSNVSGIASIAYTHRMKTLFKTCEFHIMSNWQQVTSTDDWKQLPEILKSGFEKVARNWGVLD